jgi:hypothetical protein
MAYVPTANEFIDNINDASVKLTPDDERIHVFVLDYHGNIVHRQPTNNIELGAHGNFHYYVAWNKMTRSNWIYFYDIRNLSTFIDAEGDEFSSWNGDHFTIGSHQEDMIRFHKTTYTWDDVHNYYVRGIKNCDFLIRDYVANNLNAACYYVSKTNPTPVVTSTKLGSMFDDLNRDHMLELMRVGCTPRVDDGTEMYSYKGERYPLLTGPKGGKYFVLPTGKMKRVAKSEMQTEGGSRDSTVESTFEKKVDLLLSIVSQAKVPATIFIKPKTGNCVALINLNMKSTASKSRHNVLKLNILSLSSKHLKKASHRESEGNLSRLVNTDRGRYDL